MKCLSVRALSTIGILYAWKAALAADITGTVTLSGTPPPEKAIPQIKDNEYCGKMYTDIPTTHHYIVGSKGELANVVVMLKNVTGKSTGASAEAVVLDQKACQYVPQIMAIQTGQKLIVRNSDATLHNVHFNPAVSANDAANAGKLNLPQMQNAADLTYVFPAPENFLKINCDVHPWMFAWVTVVDSPYYAVTDTSGHYKISNVPPGKYTVTAMHRKASPSGVDKDVEVKEGAAATVDFTIEAK
jgi:plastocyanin